MKGGQKGQGNGRGKGIAFLRAHVDFDGQDCLIWPFSRNPNGRGMLGFNGEMYLANRLMCELVNGPPPTPNHESAHSCGRGHDACVHPKHLSWKTRSENQQERYVHNRKPHYRRRKMLTAKDIAKIRALKGKATVAEICKKFPTSHGNVLNIWRGLSWKDGTRGRRISVSANH